MFPTLETSEYSGQPLELYKFANATKTFRYSASTETIAYLGADYLPLEGISRERAPIQQSSNLDKAALIVTAPRTSSIAREYFRRMPSTPFWLTVFRVHFGDTDTKQLWQGRIISMKAEPDSELVEFRLESIITAQNRLGLVPDFGSLCINHLYDGIGCPVLAANHARPATVTAVGTGLNRDQITVSGLSVYLDEWFEGGIFEIADGDQRDVVKWDQSTGVITLDRAFASVDLAAGDPVTVYDGCKRRRVQDCIGKYGGETNNGESHGGFDAVERNPFKSGVQ